MSKEKTDIVNLNQYKFDQLEKELRVKLLEYTEKPDINSQIGEAFYIWKNNPDLLPEDLAMDEIDESSFSRFFDWFIYDFKLIDTGKTVISTFYDETKKDLSKVEKTIIKKAQQSICSFYILEDIIDDDKCVISDIFTDQKFTIADKSTASKAKLYNILGARILQSDDSLLFSDVITLYPIAFKSLVLDFYKKEYKEYEKTCEGKASTKGFLKDWGYLIFQYLENISKNPRFLNSGGQEFVFTISQYKVLNYKEALSLLEKTESLTPIINKKDDLKVFLIASDSKQDTEGIVELDNKVLNLECYSHSSQLKIKELFESEFSGVLKHFKDTVKDLNNLIHSGKSNKNYKLDRLPPGVKSKREMDSILDDYYEQWLESPLDILEGKSPKEASISAEGKNQLHTILTELEEIYEIAKNRGEPYYNVNILRTKLNL
ncbi:MAG: hypothetical protein GWN11_03425 [Candidatus Dadabacteria bacterium]|nr:hypothetical protein [Candidatus Dadabacteria bacterium]